MPEPTSISREQRPLSGAKAPPVKEVHILWITAGLGCDGDSVSVTAAKQPSIEDVVMGAIPGLAQSPSSQPGSGLRKRRRLHEILVSGRERRSWTPSCWCSKARYPTKESRRKVTGRRWAPTPTRASRSRPTSGSIAWLPKRWPSLAPARARHTAASMPWTAIPPAPWVWPIISAGDWRSKAGLPIVNVPGCPVQPDNFMETLLYLLYQVAGLAPMIPLDEQLRPTWLFGKTVHEGCDRAGYYEQGDFAREYGSPKCLVKLGCWGPVVNCNVTKRGWMAASAAARTSAAFASAAPCRDSRTNSCRSWTNPRERRFLRPWHRHLRPVDSRSARDHQHHASTKNRSGGIRGPKLTTGYRPAATSDSYAERTERAMSTTTTAKYDRTISTEKPRQSRRDELGSDHADRRQPGHLHQDRLRQPPSRRVLQHVVNLSRL